MAAREILLLGNPLLHQPCESVTREDLAGLTAIVDDLRDTLLEFRRCHGCGRAIAAPQIGVMKRLIYWHSDPPQALINPILENLSAEKFTLWDDCMSFPDLLVKVSRHQSCTVRFTDLSGNEIVRCLKDDLSELLQHECDHLDGILATQRAIDSRSFSLRSERPHFPG
jgi:peptide deformylase